MTVTTTLDKDTVLAHIKKSGKVNLDGGDGRQGL